MNCNLADRPPRLTQQLDQLMQAGQPHRSLGQIAPCPHVKKSPVMSAKHIIAKPVLDGLHHVYQWAA